MLYTYSKSFSNLDTLRRYLNDAPVNGKLFADKDSQHSKTISARATEFKGTESYDEADGLLRDGDAENAAKLKAASGNGLKSANGDGFKTRRFSHVCGGAANVPAVLMGLPKSMVSNKRVIYKDSKVLSLVYNYSIDCTVEADEINKVSASLVNAILGLEKKGYRVNLYVGIITGYTRTIRRKESGELCAMFVKIKDSGQYIDVKKMAYPLVNPSMLRRHFFRFVETAPGLSEYRWPHGYGRPIYAKSEAEPVVKSAGINAKKIVSFYDIRTMTAPKMMQYLLD